MCACGGIIVTSFFSVHVPVHLTLHLPVHVPDDDIAEMFAFADKDGDGQLSYEEFEVDDGDGEVDKICSPTIR